MPRAERQVDGAFGVGDPGLIAKGLVDDPSTGPGRRRERVAGIRSWSISRSATNCMQGLGLDGEAVVAQEVEVLAAHEVAASTGPIRPCPGLSGRGGGAWVSTAERATMFSQAVVRLGDIEVIDGVAEGVGVGEQLSRRDPAPGRS